MQAGGFRGQFGAFREVGEFLGVDADGGENDLHLPAGINVAVVLIWGDAEHGDGVVEEGGDIAGGLETDNVAGGEAGEHFGGRG